MAYYCTAHNACLLIFFLQIQLSRAFSTVRSRTPFFISHSRANFEVRSERSSEEQQDEGIGVGIDLGTTHSCVSILEEGIPKIIPVKNGRTMPSVVNIISENEVLVGNEAIEHEVENPSGTYRNVKRILGIGGTVAFETAKVVPNLVISRSSDTASKKKSKKKKKFKKKKPPSLMKQIAEAEENPAVLYLPARKQNEDDEGIRETVLPEEISSHVLKNLFAAAEEYSGQKVTRAVIGVPAYFHDAQREATIRAAQLAGVSKVKLLREPEAAALAYGIGKEEIGRGDEDELVLVFDLGGGTYDVSVLHVGGGVTEVVATSGNSLLGGSDFDTRVAQHFAKVLQSHGVKRNLLSARGEVADAIVRSAEAVRIFLSNNRAVTLALPLTKEGWTSNQHASDVIVKDGGVTLGVELSESGVSNSTHVICELSRKTMEGLFQDELQSLLRPVREVAIIAGALLPGDSRPSLVEAAMELEEELDRAMSKSEGGELLAFEDFYAGDEGRDLAASATVASPKELEGIDSDTLQQLQEFDMKERKKAQQKGRKKAKRVAKEERKYREEKRKVDSAAAYEPERGANAKVRDGITGRPISQVVLVGGATRMPSIGRLLAVLTGVVPQRTVNPDEAVALGCAVQVGVLDGNEDLGGLSVLTPMQAAIMRAVAEKNGLLSGDTDDFDDFDDGEIIEF